MRSLRAVTGLYLLAYVTLHLINLSIGLISLEAMDAARPYLSGIWSGPGFWYVLMLALLVHYVLGLWSLYCRPSLTGTSQDVVQALSGLIIIPLLATHALGVGGLKSANVEVTYEMVNRAFWLSNPGVGLTQVLLISVVWVHGCAGLFMGLRARQGAVNILPWLYPLAVAVPVLALLGYTQAGRLALTEGLSPVIEQTPSAYGSAPGADAYSSAPEANAYGSAPETNAYGSAPEASAYGSAPEANAYGSAPEAVSFRDIARKTNWTIWISLGLGALVLGARALRKWITNPAPVTIVTEGVGQITGQTGQTLLDAFRSQNQPHANLCSGRGRCGTCAVRILGGSHEPPPATPLEQATLDRLDYGADVRLACQLPLHESGYLEIARVLPPDYTFDLPPVKRPPQKASA